MTFRQILRAVLALCIIFLTGCTSSKCRQWELQEIGSKPRFNGGRIILDPDTEFSYLELELIRNASGLYFYINLLFLEAQPWKEDPARTSITIQFEDRDPWIVHPYLLAGGQKILLPGNIADLLIQTLLDEQTFSIIMGRSQIQVPSTNFLKSLESLLELSIEQIVD